MHPTECDSVHANTGHEQSNMATSEIEDRRAIYVGNLPMEISTDVLHEIFSIIGRIHTTKLMGKSTLNAVNYAFIEYDDPASATEAIETFNGRTISGSPIKVNWAYTSSTSAAAREETSTHFSIFVGDLAAELTDETLLNAFSIYGSLSDARIMWDMQTGRSRGYGFCTFEIRSDAERAIKEMHGKWLGSRNIRCNWANLKQSTSLTEIEISNPVVQQMEPTQQYALVLAQVPANVCTIYLGNLSLDIDEQDLEPLFSVYGGALETKIHASRGFAFVKLRSHECAALAIVQLQGVIVKGRPVKISWQNKHETGRRQRSNSSATCTEGDNYAVQPVPEAEMNTRFASTVAVPRSSHYLQYNPGSHAAGSIPMNSNQRLASVGQSSW